MRYLSAFLVFAFIGFGLTGYAADPPAPEALLKARVAQLEAQLTQVQTEATVCSARLVLATAPQAQQAQQQQRAAIEKEAGCTLDWTAQPPVCKPTKPDVAVTK